MNSNFYNRVFSSNCIRGDAIFLQYGKIRFDYTEIDELTSAMAGAMSSMGVAHGDRIAAQTPKTPLGIILYLATIRLGAIFLPLNTAYTTTEIEFFLRDAAPKLFVCDPAILDSMEEVISEVGIPNCLTLDPDGNGSLWAIMDDSPRLYEYSESAKCSPTDIACLLYTSGTTGRPKGAMLTHENLSSNASALVEIWGLSGDDVLIHALPIFHIHGLLVAVNTTLVAGSKILFRTGFDANDVIDHFDKATVLMGVPTFYTRLLASERLSRKTVGKMRLFISGSAPLLAQTFADFEERTGQRILERYGMTEAGMITSNPLDGDRIAGTVGFPLPGVELKVLSAAGTPVAEGEMGVVVIKGPNVFLGYLNLPEKTAEEFTDDGFFITGDQGFVDNDGRLTIVGREKDMVISGGLNVYPKEVELVLDEIDGIVESAVFGVPHPDFGEAVVAAVVVLGDSAVSAEFVIENTKTSLASYKRPKSVFILPELPRNAMGKVQKNALRQQFSSEFDT